MAAAGKLHELIEEFTDGYNAEIYKANEKMEFLRQALSASAKKNPAGVAAALIERCLEFDALLLVRTQMMVRAKMEPWDRRKNDLESPPAEVVREDLPRLVALEDRIVMLAKALATIQHVGSLAQKPKGSDEHAYQNGRRSNGARPADSSQHASRSARAQARTRTLQGDVGAHPKSNQATAG
ncbi:MAG: hypothetical protein HY291_23400 [Planctomycetes bacterium]|nr:hypothetical protein [Planctomycetota bacterium]